MADLIDRAALFANGEILEADDGAFLPTYEDYKIRAMRFLDSKRWRYPVCMDKRCESDTHREVTHWMPLPEPPEGVQP